MFDFSPLTHRKLASKGIAIVGKQFDPEPFGEPQTYALDDNGSHLVLNYDDVVKLAETA